MKTENPGWGDEVIKQFLLDLELQESLYARMLEQTLEQKQTLAQIETPEQINALLADKQLLMNELEKVERRLAPQKAVWPTERDRLPAEIVDFTDGRMAKLQQTLRNLIDAEDEAGRIVTEKLSSGRRRLGEISRKGLAARAYAPGRQGGAQYMDDRS